MPPRRTTRKSAETDPMTPALELAPKVEIQSIRPDLADALKGMQERVARDPAEPRSKRESEQKRQEQVVAAAREATVEGIVDSLAALRLEVSGAINGLTGKLVSQAERLAQIEEAIAIEERRLAELHHIEIAADALAILLDRQAAAESDFTQRMEALRQAVQDELSAAREEAEAELQQQRAELESAVQAAQARWAREQAAHDEAVRQRDEKLKRDRDREQEEYDYTWKLRKQRDEDAYQAQLAAQQKTLQAQREAQDNALRQREQLLETREAAATARDQDLAGLRSEVEGFPKRLEKAIAEARAAGRKEAEAEARVQNELRDREIAGAREVASIRVGSLEAKVQEQAARIEELNRRLEEATTKVQNIALKAIESASGRAALSAVNEIALEQAKAVRQS